MAQVYDRENLKDAEEQTYKPPASSTSTNNGGVKYSSDQGMDYSPGSSSTSTASGGTSYTPDAPPNEQSLYRSSSTSSGKARFGSFKKRKNLIFGGLGAATAGGLIAFSVFVSGPLQLVHLSQILQHPFEKNNSDSSLRLGRLYRFAKTGNIGETRVGALGSRYFGSTIDQLSQIGVEIKTNPITGSPTETAINTDKLQSSFPELEGMSDSEKISFLSDKLGISSDLITGSGSNFTVDQADFDVKTARFLTKSTVGLLDNSSIITGLKSRVMTKFFGLPSLFHPLQRALSNKESQIVNGAQKAAAEQQDEQTREKTLIEPVEAQADGAVSAVDEEKNSPTAKLTGALTVASGACLVNNTAGDIVTINRYRVMLPAAVRAADIIAVGEQIKSGQDLSASQVGTITDGLQDQNDKTVWQGTAMNALANNGKTDASLTDLPDDYKRAFSPDTTAASIQAGVDTVIRKFTGGVLSAGTLCSPVGIIVQIGLTLVSAAIDSFSEIATDGGATPAVVATQAAYWGVKQAINVALSGLALHYIDNFILSKTTAHLAADAFSGPVGGDLLAYGARAAANTVAIAGGGIALANSTASTFISSADQQQFDSSSLANRLFNASDYRSALGTLIDNSSTSPIQNLAKIGGIFTHFGSIFSSAFSFMSPHTEAASTYDWGFPQYGLPDSLLSDPGLQNPYTNADAVAALLDGSNGNSYITRAADCFGVNISQVPGDQGKPLWDVVPGQAVNPAESSYTTSNCSDTSDENWNRVVMFVFDTNTMKAAACYEGDDQSCIDIGTNESASSTATGTTNGTGTYSNPLRDIKNLQALRIDEGVDYSGSGPIYALGNGTLINTSNIGWAVDGGPPTFIVYKLTDGPAAGKYVYAAENCTPNPQLTVGQQVTSNTVLCTLVNSSPNLETGWAEACSPGACGNAAARSVWTASVDDQQHYTDYGQNFSDLLKSLGAPPGTIAPGAQELKAITDPGWPTW